LKESSGTLVWYTDRGLVEKRYGDMEHLGLRFFFGPMKNEEKGGVFFGQNHVLKIVYIS